MKLIKNYQGSVYEALVKMRRSGIAMPSSCGAWVESNIPIIGQLRDGTQYHKHGIGCRVELDSGTIDFDFGEFGEINAIDKWKMISYANNKNSSFYSNQEIVDVFNEALVKEEIMEVNYNLYMVVGEGMKYSYDVDYRKKEDLLPIKELDSILKIYTNLFYSATFMYEKYWKFNNENLIDKWQFLKTWLGYLLETCKSLREINLFITIKDNRPDDFSELIIECGSIMHDVNENYNNLRRLRNNVFHLKVNDNSISDFFLNDRDYLQWAIKLNKKLSIFFDEYSSICEAYYVTHDRISESDL